MQANLFNFYTSRSAIETYQRCPRRRYWNYLYDGKGIVPMQVSIPLTTGTCVHKGIQHLLGLIREEKQLKGSDVEIATGVALNEYATLVEGAGFSGKGVQLDHQQQYTLSEQMALTEALIWVWALKEYPIIRARFQVVGVEREILVPLTSNIGFQARVDAELIDKRDNSHYLYSLKTIKRFSEYEEKGYKKDLQGVTETWAYEQDTHKKTMGVRYCFLVKGNRVKDDRNDPNTGYHTESPLIRGYKNIGLAGVGYAHSMYFPKPENKSGQGRLGAGWEPFNVWEDPEMGIVKWIKLLAKQTVQPECGDVLQGSCVTPAEYFRDEEDIKETIDQLCVQEWEISQCGSSTLNFPRFRHSCHYPLDCSYLDLCWSSLDHDRAIGDPVGSGLYQIRIPHHEAEKNYLTIEALDIVDQDVDLR